MSIEILKKSKGTISRSQASYNRKKFNLQANAIGAGSAVLYVPKYVSIVKLGRVSIKKQ